jgi:hypothetical protein
MEVERQEIQSPKNGETVVQQFAGNSDYETFNNYSGLLKFWLFRPPTFVSMNAALRSIPHESYSLYRGYENAYWLSHGP